MNLDVSVYDVGDLPRLTNLFEVLVGSVWTATDPTVVRFGYKTPVAAPVIWTYPTDAGIVRDGTGLYHVNLSLVLSGEWYYAWYGSTTAQGSGERRLYVRQPVVVFP